MKPGEGSPQPFDEEVLAALEFRLKLLDDAYVRARGPKRRREIERKQTEMRGEIEKMKELAKIIDIEYARWLRRFNEMLGEGR
jgi:hypothetical protein